MDLFSLEIMHHTDMQNDVPELTPVHKRKSQASDKKGVNEKKKPRRGRVRTYHCGCPCAEPGNMIRLEHEIGEEFPIRCACNHCGPSTGDGRRCTMTMNLALAAHGMQLFNQPWCGSCCEDCHTS